MGGDDLFEEVVGMGGEALVDCIMEGDGSIRGGIIWVSFLWEQEDKCFQPFQWQRV